MTPRQMTPRQPTSVSDATAQLKLSQKALTDRRLQLLEEDFIAIDEVRALVTGLAESFKTIMRSFPPKLRRRFPKLVTVETEREIFDFFSEHVCQAADDHIAKLAIKPRHIGTRQLAVRPSPKPKARS